MCVTHYGMVPAVVSMVASKGRSAYSGIVQELTCFKCGHKMTTGSDLDLTAEAPNDILTAAATSKKSRFPPHALRRWRKPKPATTTSGGGAPSHANEEKVHDGEMSLLKLLAINALDLSLPATPTELLKQRPGTTATTAPNASHWFQLSGHPDSLAPAGPGTVWKKRAPHPIRAAPDNNERLVYEQLQLDPHATGIAPRYYREVEYRGEKFIELEDLLSGFDSPNVIDIKMGQRTFLECETRMCATARHDLYDKMVAIDARAPTELEHRHRAVTKLRYMQFREEQSSSGHLGFRIEAMKLRGAPPVTDLKTVKTDRAVRTLLTEFIGGQQMALELIVDRLKDMRTKIEVSEFFADREVVGSSLFIVFDDNGAGAWLIDFAKTNRVPCRVDHRSRWEPGNHEEGLLYGFDRLIEMLEQLIE